MWVGRVSDLLPPPPTTAATTSIAHLPILLPAALSLPPKKPTHKFITAATHSPSNATSPSPIHSSAGGCSCSNGGKFNPPSHFLSRRRGKVLFPVASASSRRRRGSSPPGLLDVDGDEYDDTWEEGDDGDEEGGGPAMPFNEMRRWLRNKPAGFGEGKSYDTAIEDRLLEEMEQSRSAQLENIGKLKRAVAGQAGTKKGDSRMLEATEVAPSGARVRIRGLPQKKNIHKDLKLAFKGFPSILNISPAVVGNKKTRDPVCKGFAFVDFDSDEAAKKFVQTFSKQSVAFGRVQKEITCDLVNTSDSSNPGSEEFGLPTITQQRLTNIEGEASTEPNLVVFTQDWEENDSEILNRIAKHRGTELNNKEIMGTEDEYSSLQPVDTTMDIGYSLENIPISEESSGLRNREGASRVTPSIQKQKAQMVSRKKSAKTKLDKAPKLSMPGSVSRLKVKERAVLTGVLLKYGEQAVPAS